MLSPGKTLPATNIPIAGLAKAMMKNSRILKLENRMAKTKKIAKNRIAKSITGAKSSLFIGCSMLG